MQGWKGASPESALCLQRVAGENVSAFSNPNCQDAWGEENKVILNKQMELLPHTRQETPGHLRPILSKPYMGSPSILGRVQKRQWGGEDRCPLFSELQVPAPFLLFSFQALETVPGAELSGPRDGNKHDLNNPRLTAPGGQTGKLPPWKRHIRACHKRHWGYISDSGCPGVLSLTQALGSELERCRQQVKMTEDGATGQT